MTAADIQPNGEVRQHTRHGQERKQQLVEAAEELFAQNGYSATRVVDICKQAGVAKSLFYWYFPNKRDLFAELVRTMRLGLRRAQAQAMTVDADALTRIGQGTEASVHFIAEHAPYFALVERPEPELADILSDGRDVFVADIRRLIEVGQQEGSIPDSDPLVLAVGVIGAVSSFSNAYRNGHLDAGMTVEQLAAAVRRWVTNALG